MSWTPKPTFFPLCLMYLSPIDAYVSIHLPLSLPLSPSFPLSISMHHLFIHLSIRLPLCLSPALPALPASLPLSVCTHHLCIYHLSIFLSPLRPSVLPSFAHYEMLPAHSVYSLPTTALDSAIPARSPGSFHWRSILETKIEVLACSRNPFLKEPLIGLHFSNMQVCSWVFIDPCFLE